MQTFLPYPGFARSAACLDRQRLGKQRVEVLQILKALLPDQTELLEDKRRRGWVNHSATKMWRGHPDALAMYGVIICREWLSRGYRDTCLAKIEATLPSTGKSEMPPWLCDTAFHRSHQSNLVRKKPEHYRLYFPTVPDDLPYVWPVS